MPQGLIIDTRTYARPHAVETSDVVVVGTGAGGAVVAKELAERGLRVACVEEGGHHPREAFNRRPVDMFPLLYRDSGFTTTVGLPAIALPMGRAVGGTTLINSGTCFKTPPEVLAAWERRLRWEGLGAALAPLLEEVERELHVQEVSAELLGRNGHLVLRAFKAIGLNPKPLRRNATECRGSGVCCFGCPTGAKQATSISYIAGAISKGARIYTHARAEAFRIEKGRVVGVECGRLTVFAKAVVVSAGAVLTPALLSRNGLGHEALGNNLTIHPATRVLGLFADPIDGWRGVPQGVFVDDLKEEGIVFEGIHGPPALLSIGVPLWGEALSRFVAETRRMASFGLMLQDAQEGKVVWSRVLGRAMPLYSLGAEDVRRLVKGIALCARAFLRAGAQKVYLPVAGWQELRHEGEVDRFEKTPHEASEFELAAFHPMGTCEVGAVLDRTFAFPGIRGLYVADASVLPRGLYVNPQVTIMAIAKLASRGIAAAL